MSQQKYSFFEYKTMGVEKIFCVGKFFIFADGISV
jgi:hypothetical protein